MKEIIERKGNLIEDNEVTIICHQTNCFHTMGGGIALQIRNKWPNVYAEDGQYNKLVGSKGIFGTLLMCKTNDRRSSGRNIFVANLYGEYDYHKKHATDYKMLQKALDELAEKMHSPFYDGDVIGFPKYLGCGLAGGDWGVVYPMIRDFAKKINQQVIIDEFVP